MLSNQSILLSTILYAAEKHKDQRRKSSNAPYINHPIGVADYISSIGKVDDICVLQAAILHDVVEDTDATLDEIETLFGKTVRNIVAEVTDDRSLSKSDRKRSQVTRSFSKSHEAKLVKLADQLHNLTDLINKPLWTPVIMQGYFVWKWHVMQGLRGTNEYLEAAIDNLFNSTFEMDDTTWPTLPSTDPTVLAQLLEEYYNSV